MGLGRGVPHPNSQITKATGNILHQFHQKTPFYKQKPLNQWHLHILDLLPKLLNFLKLIVFDEVHEMDALEAVQLLLAALSLILPVLLRPRRLPLRISLRANGS